MRRNPRKLRWTKAFRKAAGKEMVVDSTLAFAARRNVPVRYNRELVATTLQAMRRVAEVRARRERVFYKQRMAGNKQRQRDEDRKLVEENQHLLPPEERTAVEAENTMAVDTAQVDSMDVDEETAPTPAQKLRVRLPKAKQRQRLLVGGGVE